VVAAKTDNCRRCIKLHKQSINKKKCEKQCKKKQKKNNFISLIEPPCDKDCCEALCKSGKTLGEVFCTNQGYCGGSDDDTTPVAAPVDAPTDAPVRAPVRGDDD